MRTRQASAQQFIGTNALRQFLFLEGTKPQRPGGNLRRPAFSQNVADQFAHAAPGGRCAPGLVQAFADHVGFRNPTRPRLVRNLDQVWDTGSWTWRQNDIAAGSDLPGQVFIVFVNLKSGGGMATHRAIGGLEVKHGFAGFLCEGH